MGSAAIEIQDVMWPFKTPEPLWADVHQGVLAQVNTAIKVLADDRGVDVQANFALNQPLSPYALAMFSVMSPDDAGYALDMISVVEATLDDPRAVLSQQEFLARGEANQFTCTALGVQ